MTVRLQWGQVLFDLVRNSSRTFIPEPPVLQWSQILSDLFGRLKDEVIKEAGIPFKRKDYRPIGGQLALDAGVPVDRVWRSMRHTSTLTTERYYCRARAEPAFARVNEAYNSIIRPEPAIRAEND